MKVIYQKTVAEKVDLAIDEAKSHGRKIEKILLSRDEALQFASRVMTLMTPDSFDLVKFATGELSVNYRDTVVGAEKDES